MLAVSLGAGHQSLVGPDFKDADGTPHPGLIPIGLPILKAAATDLQGLHARAREADLAVIAFPAFGQQTTDYDAFCAQVAQTPTTDLRYLGIALAGHGRTVRRLTGSLGLLR